jgi:hypothetical protein
MNGRVKNPNFNASKNAQDKTVTIQKCFAVLITLLFSFVTTSCSNDDISVSDGNQATQDDDQTTQLITVTDAMGNPLSGATLWLGSHSTLTDTGDSDTLTDPVSNESCGKPHYETLDQFSCTNASGQAIWTSTDNTQQKINVFFDGDDMRVIELTSSDQAITHDASLPTAIVMYVTTSTTDGWKLGDTLDDDGRNGADDMCKTDKPAALTQTNVRALLTVSSSDEIRDMPANYGVNTIAQIQRPDGTKIADNWTDLLDGSIDNAVSLSELRVWTGSGSNGSLESSFNCSEWRNRANSNGGVTAFTDVTDATWLDKGANIVGVSGASCGLQRHLYCIAFD